MKVCNRSNLRWNRQEWWDWEVYLEEEENENLKLDDIKSVKYFLHSSFDSSVMHSSNSKNNFMQRSSGWGEFLMGIELETRRKEYYHSLYWLDLGFENTEEDKKQYPGTFKKGKLSKKLKDEILE